VEGGAAAKLALAGAYLRTRALHGTFTNRHRIERWQSRRLEVLRRHAIAKTAFYRRLGDVSFNAFPVIAKADVMGAFEDFNMLGLSAPDAWRLLEQGAAPPGYDLGCSTGTSGNRGLYLISDRERFVWLGTIVAKAIPDVLRRRHRVAIILPRASRLYDAANESRLITLQFYDLGQGLDSIARSIATFNPTIVVGPPKALRWMAEHGTAIRPGRMFASAEVLDDPDRRRIEAAYGLRLGQIYMATEGLFGVSCAHGTLHLAEDAVHFEYEPAGETAGTGQIGLVSPVVTDFTRRTQVMARYRMNDLLRLSPSACPCGSALQAVDEIVGRRDDCFELPSSQDPGRAVTITPDMLRNAVLGSDRGIDDFRVRQTGSNAIELVLPLGLANETASAARQALLAACLQLGTKPDITVQREALPVDTTAKLRRVERRWDPDRHERPGPL
jgi:putative adenylate-forming enzyme